MERVAFMSNESTTTSQEKPGYQPVLPAAAHLLLQHKSKVQRKGKMDNLFVDHVDAEEYEASDVLVLSVPEPCCYFHAFVPDVGPSDSHFRPARLNRSVR